MTRSLKIGSDNRSDDDNVVDLVHDNEDDQKPSAKSDEYDNNDGINYGNDDEDSGEEDPPDEVYDDVEDAISKFLFDYDNFYVNKEGDYHGDVGGVDNNLIAGGPQNLTA